MSAEPQTDTWPYWLQLGGAALATLFFVSKGYGANDVVRQRKLLCASVATVTLFMVSGAFAQGQGWLERDDSAVVHYGRQAANIVLRGGLIGMIVYSISPHFVDVVAGIVMSSLGALCTLFMTLSDSNMGKSPRTLAWWTGCAGGFNVLLLLLMGSIVLGWKRWVPFPSAYRDAEGYAILPTRGAQLAVTWFTFAIEAAFTVLVALGPEGFRVYSDQQQQLWLLMAVPTAVLVLFSLWVFFNINADGALNMGDQAYRILDTAQLQRQQQSVNASIQFNNTRGTATTATTTTRTMGANASSAPATGVAIPMTPPSADGVKLY